MIHPLNNIKQRSDLALINQLNETLLMDVSYEYLKENQILEIFEETKEVAILLLDGQLQFTYENKIVSVSRTSLFDDKPSVLHVSLNTKVSIKALSNCSFLVQKAINQQSFQSILYMQADIREDYAGFGVLNDCATRIIRTVFDYDNAPYSKMVLGEVINYPGKWSSYIPHWHQHPELYYYRFDHEQGFGACFKDEEVTKIINHSYTIIDNQQMHPQVSAPGYAMYYCWMIAHLPNNPWQTRHFDEKHEWLLKEDAKIWSKKEEL
ncbi:MAG: 5-deoxy-glucuronate isomerase [Bacilli bacterium]